MRLPFAPVRLTSCLLRCFMSLLALASCTPLFAGLSCFAPILLFLCLVPAADLDALQADLAGLGLEPATAISATSGEGLADLYQLLQPIVDEGVQQLNQRAGLGSRSSRQLVPPAYRFSAPNALQQQQQQDQKQQQQGGDAVGSIPRGTAAEQQQQQEEAALAAAAAAEADEVDRLVQQQQLAAGNANDSDEEAIIAVASSNSSSSTSPSSAPAVHDEALGDEPEGGSGGSSGSGAPLRMAILGLPNAGKSTLMNTLLGYERSLTGRDTVYQAAVLAIMTATACFASEVHHVAVCMCTWESDRVCERGMRK